MALSMALLLDSARTQSAAGTAMITMAMTPTVMNRPTAERTSERSSDRVRSRRLGFAADCLDMLRGNQAQSCGDHDGLQL